MTSDKKLIILNKLQRRIKSLMSSYDFGEQTEYLDRAADQIAYAIGEVEEDELEFQESL